MTNPVAAEIARDCLAVRVRLLNRTLTRVYDNALRPLGLTVSQLNILSTVANLQPIAAGRVSELLSMEISTLSRNMRILQAAGLLDVTPAERGNGKVLRLTEAGDAKLVQAKPAWDAAQTQARELLGTDAADTMRRVVDEFWAPEQR